MNNNSFAHATQDTEAKQAWASPAISREVKIAAVSQTKHA